MNQVVHQEALSDTPETSAAARRLAEATRTRADILDVAAHAFSEKGLAGARINEIAPPCAI